MKNYLMLVVILTLAFGCSKPKKVEVNPIPKDKNEWQVKLSSPVVAEKQKVQTHFLPAQVLEVFKEDMLLFTDYLPVNSVKRTNCLPGNDYVGWGITGRFIYWNVNNNDKKEWNWETDPKDFLYIIKYKHQYPETGLIALWFVNDSTIQCKKLDMSTKKRQTTIWLPRFSKAVKWEWRFEGSPCSETELAKGKVIESSAQNGYSSATTMWHGGGKYKLPNIATTIVADGKIVYAE